MNERDLMRTVDEYLRYQQNMGKLWFTRLNSGNILAKKGDKFYNVKLCDEGTADFEVVKGNIDTMIRPRCRVIFLELKSETGKQSLEQGAFQKIVENQGASYFIIRSIEDLTEALGN